MIIENAAELLVSQTRKSRKTVELAKQVKSTDEWNDENSSVSELPSVD